MNHLIRFLKPFWFSVLLIIGLLYAQAMTDLALPDYMSRIVNIGLQQGLVEQGSVQYTYILQTGGTMLLIALLGVIFAVLVGFLSSRVAAGLAKNLRSQIFRKVESFANAEFDHFSTASLITRTTNDIQQIQNTLVMLLRVLFFAPMMAIGGILKILAGDRSMGWIIALAILAVLTLIGAMFAIALPKFKVIQSLIDRLNLVTREILTGLMVNRAFNTQASMQEKFARANADLTNLNLFVSRAMSAMFPFMMLIMNFTTLAIVWVGGHQVDAGNMQVGDMMAFMQYATTILFSFLMVSMIFIMMPRASVAASRVVEVIDMDLSILDPEHPKKLAGPVQGEIEFKNVFFRYPGADDAVLNDISLIARPGQTTALIGSTGSGKSTLVNLIPRFYDVSEGQILLDGLDIRQLSQFDLRQAIGYVPQKGVLFTGDIKSNIGYGQPDADDQVIAEAAATAQALDFIDNTDEKYATIIAQGGSNVSGGQRQRLSIARALAKKPPVFIFDDSFSALDYKTDAALRQALKEKTADSTVIIVAQRIGTIRHAEQIIVLDEGRIVGRGTHSDLLKTCPVYAEIAASQLSAEELEK